MALFTGEWTIYLSNHHDWMRLLLEALISSNPVTIATVQVMTLDFLTGMLVELA